ncbi:DUF2156 domain-containing protein [Candidatus Sumerlaeota bacterium]|nr:DUF2156 domain-containing protein [Candidatus Sumerlaeota bacterium]
MSDKLKSFRSIEFKDREILEAFFTKYDKAYSIYNFANLFLWSRHHQYKWSIYMDRLLLYTEYDDMAAMPLGEDLPVKDLLRLSDELSSLGKKGNFCFTPPEYIEKNKDLSLYFDIQADEKNADYVYSTRKLFELSGKKLQKKKNLLNQFQRNNPNYICQKLVPEHYNECIDLTEKWCQDKTCDIVAFAYETEALRAGCKHYRELGLEGLIILIEGKVTAFAVFNRQNSNTALVHFEKYDRDVKGAGQAINWETAKRLLNEYEYLNREQDLGIEGLRQAKQSYQPEFLALMYCLTRKG